MIQTCGRVIVRFLNFELDDELFELRRDGAPRPIQRKTFDLLLYLARSRGAVVTRDELIREVWPSVVVSEPALTQAILTVRKALDDDANDPKIVKTVRGRGYRFAETATLAEPARQAAFVGRGRELSRLEQAVAEARVGRGRVVLVVGEQGVGKSALVSELESRLESAGSTRVLRGHAFHGEGAPSLWPWIQIGRRLGLDDDFVPDALETSEAAFIAGDRIVRRLFQCARETPLVVVIEDLQWADAASLDLLLSMAPRLSRAPVVIVLTTRTLETREARVGAVLRLPLVSTVELGRFGKPDVAALLSRLTARRVGDAVVERVLEKTGGNPSLIVQIAHVLEQDAAAVGTSTMLPTGAVKQAIAHQVAALAPEVRDVLAVAAVLGLSFDSVPLALVTGAAHEEVLTRLDAAIAEGVVARGGTRTHRFTQPLVRDALYRTMPDAARLGMHARVARALLEIAGDRAVDAAAEIAPHLVAAAPLGEAGAAIDFAMRAHEHARETGDQVGAQRFVSLAREALAAARPAERSSWESRLESAAPAATRRSSSR